MKIALVFDNMKFGGIQRVGISYLKIFKELGYSVDTYILNPNTESIVEEAKELSRKVYIRTFSRYMSPEIYYVLAERFWWGKFVLPIIFPIMVLLNYLLRMFSLRKKYDVAIAFSGHPNDLNYVGRNFVRARKKCCWLHGAQYDYYMMSIGYAFLYKKIRNLIVLSNLCDISCGKKERLFNLSINKVYNPIKIAEKAPDKQKLNFLKEKYDDYILYIGRLANDKDPETIIRSMHYLKTSLGIEKHLVIVGDGNKKEKLHNLTTELGLTNFVHFEGIRKDVENYYCSAYLFVHSSPMEGLPTTLLESMSYKLPIVATDSLPGVREILGNNEYGVICPVGDFVSMSMCIARMYKDKVLYSSLQSKGLIRLECFNTERIKRQITEVLNNLK